MDGLFYWLLFFVQSTSSFLHASSNLRLVKFVTETLTCTLACEMVLFQGVAFNTDTFVQVPGGHTVLWAGPPLVTWMQVGTHASVRQQRLTLGTGTHRSTWTLRTVLLTLHHLTVWQSCNVSHMVGFFLFVSVLQQSILAKENISTIFGLLPKERPIWVETPWHLLLCSVLSILPSQISCKTYIKHN